MLRWPSTLRWRLTLWYTALLGAPLIALAIGYYFLFARTLAARTDNFIGDALTAFSRELIAERRASLGPVPAIRSTVDEVRFRDLHIAVLDSARNVVAMTPLPAAELRANANEQASFAALVGPITRAGLADTVARTVRGRAGDYRVIARPVELADNRFELTGTYSLHDIESVLGGIRHTFAVLIPLLLVCAATGGWFLATRSLAPLSAMAARAEEISATNLRERLPVWGGQELAGLARVVNDLLARLEQSFTQQRRFMADASHELRTPTAILRTEADVTLAQEHRSEAEYRASMMIIRDAARRLTRIVDDLFLLARADSGSVAARREPLYLEELVYDATRSVRPLADSRNVRVELGEVIEAPFAGDADLLGRLLLNLLDNAIKHSPAGGVVAVDMARRNGAYAISVVDAGPGVPAEDRERIFERFVRLEPTRDPDSPRPSGAGLGLAISRRIAEAHGGALALVDSRPGRTEFRITLPVG
ncbi:MAG TPA: ATP-binding protein [Gemmatimonadaceae bacterium]|nr:ATP-binding protein [Gemmatimonadaceae bacterium]